MKKKYIQPNILCERLASYSVITTSPDVRDEVADPEAPTLAPKRQSIWGDEN